MWIVYKPIVLTHLNILGNSSKAPKALRVNRVFREPTAVTVKPAIFTSLMLIVQTALAGSAYLIQPTNYILVNIQILQRLIARITPNIPGARLKAILALKVLGDCKAFRENKANRVFKGRKAIKEMLALMVLMVKHRISISNIRPCQTLQVHRR